MKSIHHSKLHAHSAFYFFCLLSAILLLNINRSVAQDFNESPYFLCTNPANEPPAMVLQSTDVYATISGVIADVEVRQFYTNTGSSPLEAVYVFPASTRSAVYAMEMVIGDRIITAKIEEKAKARKQYNTAKAQGKRASLLEEERPNIFKMNVANIAPNETVEVTLRYTETLIPENKEYSFVFPTVVGPRYRSVQESIDEKAAISASSHIANTADLNIAVNLNAGLPIQSIACISHQCIKSQPTPSTAKIVLNDSVQNKDFVVRYSLAGAQIETGMLTYEGADGENYFMAMIQPPANVTAGDIPPREYIFIVDVSGSMRGYPLDISKQVLSGIFNQLNEQDLFNIIYFAGSGRMYAEHSLPATAENIQSAIEFTNGYQGYGGTELLCAIKAAFSLQRETEYARTFAIFTDGYVTVEKETFDYIREHLGDANFFSLGIGNSVNRYIIEGMAHVGCAEPFIALNKDEAKVQAEKFTQYISNPVLTNIQYQFKGMEVYDVLPEKVPDVFADRPIIISGKYHKRMKGQLQLTGTSGNQEIQQSIQLKPSDNETQALSYLWAREKIRLLADYSSIEKDRYKTDTVYTNDLKQQITELGLQYNLLTEYTSFIAIDNEGTIDIPDDYLQQEQHSYALNDLSTVKTTRQQQIAPPPPPPPIRGLATLEADSETEIEFIEIGSEDEQEEVSDATVFMVVEKMPQFPGGDDSLRAYLNNNIVYPPEALTQNITGRVYVSFVIDVSGKITDVAIARGVDPLLDAEALRVVTNMPNWIPGSQRGKPVNVKYLLPVNFGNVQYKPQKTKELKVPSVKESKSLTVPPC